MTTSTGEMSTVLIASTISYVLRKIPFLGYAELVFINDYFYKDYNCKTHVRLNLNNSYLTSFYLTVFKVGVGVVCGEWYQGVSSEDRVCKR